jgi:DNA-binding transcriptional ArsR family regulator
VFTLPFSHIAERECFVYHRSMKEGPDISQIGALIGDPARANMLTALMGGQALTATELAGAAGVTLQTASAHLSKLEGGGLVTQRKQGRHRYFALGDDEVGLLLENIMGFAANRGLMRTPARPEGPGTAQGARLLQPPCRRFRRAHARPAGGRRGCGA